MLIFLPTERDIREAAKRLRADKTLVNSGRNTEILPLYARLSTGEQNRIFNPGKARRIVLATNVAESSLTVPRIHSVIDTGTARISRYSPRLRVQRLPIEAISQASANQRKGRCGRLGPGVCIRLYSEEDFAGRSPYTTPEIRRTNLASVILQAKYLRLGELDQIPLLDPPRPETIREGYKTLFELGAVEDDRRLTELGRKLAQFPTDPRIARMILAAHEQRCLPEVLIIAAALEIQDPRLRPVDRQQAADEKHARFVDESSDFLSYLKLWDYVQQQREDLSRGKFQRLCQQEFLSPARLREWHEVHRQLLETTRQQGLKPGGSRRDESAAIHKALLCGLLSCVAQLTSEHEYTGAGGNKFFLWPGSGLFSKKPKWVMAAELVETRRRYGRVVAQINPAWLEPLAEHIVKRTCSDAHWHEKSLSVMAFERVTLFGLPIVARRRIPFGHIDPDLARQVFIEKGLVEQKMEVADAFFRNNQALRIEAEQLAAKTRRREYVLDDYRLHTFYQERLPEEAVDMASLRKCLRKDPQLQANLTMTLQDLLPEEEVVPPESFPATIDVGPMKLPLKYSFEPGADSDGVTMTVPAEALSQVHREHLEWLVPGLIEQKLVALIRSLPKALRRGLVPAPDTARTVASELDFGKGVFLQVVADRFSAIAGEPIAPQDFRLEKVPDHLRLRVEVTSNTGEVQAAGRDLQQVRSDALPSDVESGAAESDLPAQWNRDQVTNWDFEDLPEHVRVLRGSIEVVLFPAILDQQDAVGIRLLETRSEAQLVSRGGLRRLYLLANRKPLRSQVRWLPQWNQVVMWMMSVMDKQELEEQTQLLLADRAFLANKLPRTKVDFESRHAEKRAADRRGDPRSCQRRSENRGTISCLPPGHGRDLTWRLCGRSR